MNIFTATRRLSNKRMIRGCFREFSPLASSKTRLGTAATATASTGTKHSVLLATRANAPIYSTPSHSISQKRSYEINRAFPSYSVMGDNSLLTMKPIMPKFKSVSNDAISLQQKGRMLIEFAPKNASNQPGFQWDEKIGFALSVEEIGLLISQLPHYGVTLSRKVGGDQSTGFNGGSYDLVSSSTNESIDKVLTAQPGDGATITFRIDYMKDGMGGQLPPASATNESSRSAPLEVTVEAGEWEVLLSLFKESLPYFCGWNKMMDIGIANAIQNRDD
mmetsp:Transcript_11817/g.17720  ORF Transcript_11817/g.17720 Transcript_11817/m.17720 type:complete len:276 (-) Transcript_11817:5394-6221(-)